jgi:hypothetical protein
MRIPVAIACILISGSFALAQSGGDNTKSGGDNTNLKGVEQPQGLTGPLNTTSGGNPPENPEGDTPPGMQTNPGAPNPK